MSSKHLSDDPLALVRAALGSLAIVNPSVAFDSANKVVYLPEACASSKVSVMSGGGSGHEPSFAGFVGAGMLSAAVAGSIFASPSADQVFRCLMRLGSESPKAGILIVLMNYTGDKLHFGMAMEKAKALGVDVDLVVVGDDVGVGRKRSGRIGRRGLAGTVLVQKIAGAYAAQGASLAQVSELASLAGANVATVGASLSHVHVPGRAVDADELDHNDEIEIGMGIHNEEGFGRVRTDLPGLIKALLKPLLDTADPDRGFVDIKSGEAAVLMVNNLGGLSNLELGAVTMEATTQLSAEYGIVLKRVLSGAYMTSLNGVGFSLTLLKLADQRLLEMLDASTEASGWIPAAPAANWAKARTAAVDDVNTNSSDVESSSSSSNLQVDQAHTRSVLGKALQNIIDSEPEVTKYDTLVGDGDCGLCLKTGAEAVLAHVQSKEASMGDAVQLVTDISHVVEKSMDGTSGALYAIFLSALSQALQQADSGMPQKATPAIWAGALQSALQTLGKYTPARPGDRTVVDALAPFVETFKASGDLSQAVEAAKKGCDSTKGMQASLGRSVYVGGDEWKYCPDPGAFGLLRFLQGLVGR